MAQDSSIEPQIVRPDQNGIRLGDFLEQSWPSVDRVFLRRLLQQDQVQVNRMEATGRTKLLPGDEVRITLPEGVEALPEHRRGDKPEAMPEVLAENELCLVVDKPAGMPTVPDRGRSTRGVHGYLSELRPDDDLRIAHRLDRDTSGCLVLAKGLDGAHWLDQAFRDGAVEKEYLALVEGRVARQSFTVKKWLGPDKRRPGKVVVAAEGAKMAREALTEVEVEERFRGFSLLRVRPRTGRGHQIRVHLRAVGHPIVADMDYGAKGPLMLSSFKPGYKLRKGVAETPLLKRMFLHAARIQVPMPDGAAPLIVTAPLADELDRALRKLQRFATAAPRGEA